MARLSITLLGAVRVTVDDIPIAVDTRKAIALLAYLAVTGTAHRREPLAALLWPDADDTHARSALRRTLSTLVTALDGRWLDVTRDHIGLATSADVWVDVIEFRNLTRAQGFAGSRKRLASAVVLYQADFMAGFSLRDSPEFDDWQRSQAEGFRADLARALLHLFQHASADADFGAAVAYARRLVSLDPLNEDAHCRLMEAHAWAGERAAALRQYRECVRALDEELGVAPLASTTTLYELIAQGHTPLAPQPLHVEDIRHEPEMAVYRASSYPFVGREAEVGRLRAAHASVGPHGLLVALTGEAGIGKTRLATEFLDDARSRGARVVETRAYEGETGLALSPFADALRSVVADERTRTVISSKSPLVLSEAARLQPDVSMIRGDIPPAAPSGDPGAQVRFFDAVTIVLIEALRGEPAGILFIDDSQWLDSASLDLLTYIARRIEGRPVMLLVAWRDEQGATSQRLLRLLDETGRAGHSAGIHVPRLDLAAVQSLMPIVIPGHDDFQTDLARRLLGETGGLPLYLVEYMHELRADQHVATAENWPVPAGMRNLLRARIASISGTESQILTTLAAIGRGAEFDVLREASGRSDDETVSAIELLLATGLVVERHSDGDITGEPSFEIAHQHVGQIVYGDTSFIRRRLLHRRIAESLSSRARHGERGRLAGVVAHHFQLAGRENEAAEAYRLAGEHSRSVFANREAMTHFQAAIALAHPQTALLHERIGDLHMLGGAFDAARTSFEIAASLTLPGVSASIEQKIGGLYHRLGEWDLAEQHYLVAESILTETLSASRGPLADLYVGWSLTALQRGDMQRSVELAQHALDLAGAIDDARLLAAAHNVLGILARHGSSTVDARHHFSQSLQLAEAHSIAELRVAAGNNLALLEHVSGNTDTALQHAADALELCIAMGDLHRQAALHSNVADMLHASGRPDDALEHFRQSALIYRDIGIVAGEHQPEIWKLAEW